MLEQEFEDVLRAAQAGAGWACTRLYEWLSGPVTAYVRQRGALEPDDVASETFLQVFRSLERFAGDAPGFRAWVFTIAHRRLQDDWRARGRRPRTDPIDGVDVASAQTVEMDVLAAVAEVDALAMLEVLTEPQREVVLLRIIAGLSVAETAAVTNTSEDAVRQLQRRGLQALAAAAAG